MKKVVFLDDSKTVLLTAQMAVEDLVEKKVIEFIGYDNPLKLLEDVESGKLKYDLLITDINMPQMNGLDVAKKLKSMPDIQRKPILALTTENAKEKKALAKGIGLAGWITKPFDPQKLVMGIKRVLRIR